MSHVPQDDPPIGLFYGGIAGAKKGEDHPDPTHSPRLGLMLMEKLNSTGVEEHISYTGMPSSQYTNATAFLIERLKKSFATSRSPSAFDDYRLISNPLRLSRERNEFA